jgi:hypothetical protein
MSKRHDKEPTQEIERELTLKEQRLRHRDRERHKKLYMFIGGALGLALLLVLVGVVYQFLVVPNTTAAKVGNVSITAADFQKRVRYTNNTLQRQLAQLQQLEQQFGGQGFFQTQIAQLQATLSSPFSVGTQALDGMIEDILITNEATARSITVTDEEVDAALREEIASGMGLVTEPQATATAEAGVAATATAAQWTPTPTATVDPSAVVTATVAAPTPEPLAPAAIITETTLTEGLGTLEKNLSATAGLSLNEYRSIVRARLLREKLQEVISSEQVTTTEEQVHARHILLTVAEPTPSAPITGTDTLTDTGAVTDTAAVTTTADVTDTADVTGTAELTTTESVTPTTAVTATAAATATTAVTPTATVTATQAATATATVTGTAAVTDSAALTDTAGVTDTAGITATAEITGTHGPYTEAEALALANELRERILAGEDFAALAKAYSDDTSSGANGGDLGWFGRNAMVAPFEEAAFSLAVGEVSEPVKTDFGYHLIEVLERDDARPKDESQLQQERAQAFSAWLTEQMANNQIERAGDISALLPPGL